MLGRMDGHALLGHLDDPDVARSLQEAAARVEALYAELYDAYPALRDSLAIAGMMVGHGLGAFVASDLTDDQIVAHVLDIVSQIRQVLANGMLRV